jgi:hypothetical protein
MAKEFNPDEFLQDTAPIAEAQADIERRNTEKVAAGQPPMTPQQAQASMSPSGAPIAPVRPGFSEAPGEYLVNNVVAPAYGAYKAGSEMVAQNPGLAGAAAYGASYVPGLNKLPGISTIKAGREAATNILNRFAAPVNAPVAPTVGAPGYPIGGAPAPAASAAPQATMLDKTTAMIRQLAANRALQSAAVPGAVAVGGAALSSKAANQLAAMTPEQRKAYYDSAMMGAMSGDAGLAAAIMNRGQ